MKSCIYLATLLLLGVVACRNIDEKNTLLIEENANKVDDNSAEKWSVDSQSTAKVVEKCKAVGGEAAAKKFLAAVDVTTACLNKEIPKTQGELKKEFDSENDDGSDSICSKKRKTFRNCFVDVIEAIKDCSREEEKYAPDFLFDAIDGLLDFVCADNGKVVNDVINANETDQCIEHLVEKIFSGNMTYLCTENFKLFHKSDDDIMSKPELCSDLHTAKTCYSAFLARECPSATALNTLLVGAFNSVSTPCKDVPVISTLPALPSLTGIAAS